MEYEAKIYTFISTLIIIGLTFIIGWIGWKIQKTETNKIIEDDTNENQQVRDNKNKNNNYSKKKKKKRLEWYNTKQKKKQSHNSSNAKGKKKQKTKTSTDTCEIQKEASEMNWFKKMFYSYCHIFSFKTPKLETREKISESEIEYVNTSSKTFLTNDCVEEEKENAEDKVGEVEVNVTFSPPQLHFNTEDIEEEKDVTVEIEEDVNINVTETKLEEFNADRTSSEFQFTKENEDEVEIPIVVTTLIESILSVEEEKDMIVEIEEDVNINATETKLEEFNADRTSSEFKFTKENEDEIEIPIVVTTLMEGIFSVEEEKDVTVEIEEDVNINVTETKLEEFNADRTSSKFQLTKENEDEVEIPIIVTTLMEGILSVEEEKDVTMEIEEDVNIIVTETKLEEFNADRTSSEFQFTKENGKNTRGSQDILPSSLTEIGATCYFNNALLGLSSCDVFVNEMMLLSDVYPDIKELSTFISLIESLNKNFKENLEMSQNIIFQKWNKHESHDSYEILINIFNNIYQKIKDFMISNETINIKDSLNWILTPLPLKFVLETNIRCGCGKITNSKFLSQLTLYLTIPHLTNLITLDDLLTCFFEESHPKYKECNTLDCAGSYKKKNTYLLDPLPKTTCIHIKRTFWNGICNVKIGSYVKFEKEINLKSFFSENNRNELSKSESQKNNSRKYRNNLYELKAVLAKSNDGNENHYICYKLHQNVWKSFGDYFSLEVDEAEVLQCQASILYYEMTKKDENKIISE